MYEEITLERFPDRDPRQHLPSVSLLLEHPAVLDLIEAHSRPLTLDAIHDALDWFRARLQLGESVPELEEVVSRIADCLWGLEQDRIRPVVNATGIILHTGLGRAVLPQRAVDALAGLTRCCNLQIDIETGQRGKRNYVTEQLICRLTGAEAAVVVNNNAGATLLILTALCQRKEVIVSRGQLIEIGGSYRLPDCVHYSGAILVEVGTTNKTHLRDYEPAINENTGAVMRVNPSNYRVIGFSKEVPIQDLVALKKKHDVLVIDDLGCGALVNLEQFGLPHEPTAPDSIAAGADIVCFSGDKLIGGPQAGIIVGKKPLIDRIRKHPLMRMLRVDKLTDMALEQTLRLFLEPETLRETNPTIRMITIPAENLKRQATRIQRKLAREAPQLDVRVVEGSSMTGGGSLPATPIPTFLLTVASPAYSAEQLSQFLRRNEPPIIVRVKDDEVLLDMRTLTDGDEALVVRALKSVDARER